MERRLLTFIVASTAFFFIYISLRQLLVPPPPPEAPQAQQAEQEAIQPPAADGEDAGEAGAPESDEPSELVASEEDGAAEPAAPGAADRPEQPQWVTLGSMDPASGYLMLITLNSRGGGIERIELTAREEDGGFKYRRVDVRDGYLGYFAGEPASEVNGVQVNVVGPGTPAANALAEQDGVPDGLTAGDVIIEVDGIRVSNPAEIEAVLDKTEPGDEVKVKVRRPQTGDDSETPPESKSFGELRFTATLTHHPLDLVRLAESGGPDQIPGNLSRLSCLLTLSNVDGASIAAGERSIEGFDDPAYLVWDVEKTAAGEVEAAEFQIELSESEMAAIGGEPVRLRHRYALAPNTYAIDMTVQVDNLAEETQQLAYRLEGLNGLTLEGWWYSNKISPHFGGAAARDIVYKTAAQGHELVSGYELLEQARDETQSGDRAIFAPDSAGTARQLRYIGVDAQYFTTAYVPPAGEPALENFRRAAGWVVADPEVVPENQERAVNSSFYLDSSLAQVPAGQSIRQDLRIYAGPKRPEVLESYGLGELVYYGWFGPVAILLGNLLHLLYYIVGNYAIAIILLTVLVRAAMFPLSRKAAVNAQRMQELAPELKKIAEKYKDDMEGRLKAQRELQQRVGFNPMAGCLPMFLQLPIFIGLYRALSVDIELRQAALSEATSWASNLAGPDMLVYWGGWLWEYLSGRGTGWLGPYFNILPMLVVVLFLAQQKMFMPPPTDEQQAMTQKVMSYMTLLMGLFFFRVPAGLCIYFITSSIWGICERIIVKKTVPEKQHFDRAVLEGTATKANARSSSSLAERLRQQLAPGEPPATPPSKRKRPPTGKKKK